MCHILDLLASLGCHITCSAVPHISCWLGIHSRILIRLFQVFFYPPPPGDGRIGRSPRIMGVLLCGSYQETLSSSCLIFDDAEVDQWIWVRKAWFLPYEVPYDLSPNGIILHCWPLYTVQNNTESLLNRRIFPHQLKPLSYPEKQSVLEKQEICLISYFSPFK